MSPVPIPVSGLSGIRAIAAGGGGGVLGDHSLAVTSDGTVWAWGANGKGQLGDGTRDDRLTPVQVLNATGTGPLSDIRQVAAGARHSLALDKDGHVWAWGDNTFGQLGDGTYEDRAYPGQVTGLSDVVMIAAGWRHSVAIDADGRVWIWGRNTSGQIGNGTTENSSVPVQISGMALGNTSATLSVNVNPPGTGTTVPSGTRRYRLGTTAGITARAVFRYQFHHWSGDATGVETAVDLLMDGNKSVTANFVLIPGLDCNLTMVSSPADGGYLVPTAGIHQYPVGTVLNISAEPGYRYRFGSWSNNVANPSSPGTTVTLTGDTTVTASFQRVPFATNGVICAGYWHALQIAGDSTVYGSGSNGSGQLGIGSDPVGYWPVQMHGENNTGVFTGAIGLAAGADHSAVLAYDGTVFTCGSNFRGQLGDGTRTSRSYPGRVKSPDGSGWLTHITALSAGYYHTAALRQDGTVWCWGRNDQGQLGDNTVAESVLLPVQVRGEMGRGYLTGVKEVSCGAEHTLAVMNDGTVRTWGSNLYGVLGNGASGEFSAVPVAISNLSQVKKVAGCKNFYNPFSLALKEDGTVWAWGGNNYGQLGNGTTTDQSSPVRVGALTNIVAIAAGSWHSLALRSDGTVWAWGANWHGELGDGTNDDRTSPVQVKGLDGQGFLTDVVAIDAGDGYSMALKSDGTVWAWGYNAGNVFGNPAYHTAPVGYSTPVRQGYLVLPQNTPLVFLSVRVSPEGAGTTVPMESVHAYNVGTVVNLRASESFGYQFSCWSEGPEDRFSSSTTLLMDRNRTVTAYFEILNAGPGDINRDGLVNILDAILCLRMSLELPVTLGAQMKNHPYPSERIRLADMNSDGDIDITDVVLLVRRVIGLGTTVPGTYDPRPVVPPETTPESASRSVPAGQEGLLALSDGTSVSIPSLTTPYSIVLDRQTNVLDLTALGQETSGSCRYVTLTFDQTPTETDIYQMMPVITIPASEVGSLNPDTVNICRVLEKIVAGKVVREYGFLPAFRDSNGNYLARDVFVPADLLAQGSPPAGATKATGGLAPLNLAYVPSTFQGNINWVRPCQLVRMVPDRSLAAKRQPLDKLSDEDKEWERKKPIKNVIVLVHGHNETEKAGIPGTYVSDEEKAPWFFSYKKDVWTPLYEKFLAEYPEFNGCTVFYEFIYPSWRPIFGHLDNQLVSMITEELKVQLGENDQQKVLPFNLFLVAHSMGGIVSRAGIVNFSEKLDAQFKHLVTWGSPHHGSALYSFRYLMANPAYRFRGEQELSYLGPKTALAVNLVRFLSGYYITSLALDTPGVRDLLWTNGPASGRRYLTFDSFMTIDALRAAALYGPNYQQTLDMRSGNYLFNVRLQQLNAYDRKGDRYTFLYGVTEQGIPDDFFSGDIWDVAAALEDVGRYLEGDIAKGATMNRFFIENGNTNFFNGHREGRSDGAVPIISAAGLGITSNHICLGDIDHEQFFNLAGKASVTARTTFETLGFKVNPEYDPPEVQFDSPSDDEPLEVDESGRTTISGTLVWPGDDEIGKRVKQIKLFRHTREHDQQTRFGWEGIPVPLDTQDWQIGDDGSFSITCTVPDPEKVYALKVVFVFIDATELPGVVMLGHPDEFQTTCMGETIRWSVEGLNRVFLLSRESTDTAVFTYERAPAGETPTASISASVNPVYQTDDRQYHLFIGAYSSEGGFPKTWNETAVSWPLGQELPPPELAQLDVSHSAVCEPGDLFVVSYLVAGDTEPDFYKFITVYLFPWPKREKTDLMPPYFRPQPLPPEEP